MTSDLSSINDFLEEFLRFLNVGISLGELGIGGTILLVGLITSIITAVISFIFQFIIYVLEAFPVYKLARKTGRKCAWLAWIPVFGSYFRLYVLADIAGDKELVFFGKFKLKNRPLSFWMYVGIDLFGSTLITAVIGILQVLPVIGQIIGALSTLLYLVPPVAKAFIEYAYLRDVLNIFKEDKKANNTASIVVTALDALATFGFARVVYLYTILKHDPIPEKVMEVAAEEVPVN